MKHIRLIFAAILLLGSLNAHADYKIQKIDSVSGTVTDTDGHPLEGVVVSDGYQAVATASDGTYSLTYKPAAYYVHCSIPSGYEVPMRNGQPMFYRKIDDRAKTYDFILKPLKSEEKSFSLFVIGDPQPQNPSHVRRMQEEGIADIKAYSRRQKGSCYAITMGDLGYSEGGRNTNYLMPLVREAFRSDNTGMPVFHTVGNHDFDYAQAGLDRNNPTPTLRRDRMYECVFGPVDYSWNRGDVHFVTMNNVHFEDLETSSNYHIGISDEQLEWLREDLSFVPKDRMIVMTVHIPIAGKDDANSREAVRLIGEFKEAVIFSGHTHTSFKNFHPNGVRELTVAALSGCWWWSRLCSDGTPQGYLVCHFDGAHMTDHIYKASCFKESYQMRIYRGDAEFGGQYDMEKLPFGHDALLVNVWNWEKGDALEFYENGKLAGTLTRPMPKSEGLYPDTESSKDWWAIGYHIGVVGRGPGNRRRNYCPACTHMFLYRMKDPDAKVKVVFKDNYGRKFTETHIFETDEYKTYADPPQYDRDNAWIY